MAPSRYHVRAKKSGLVAAVAELDAPSTEALTLSMGSGMTVAGRITGATPEELASVRVYAASVSARGYQGQRIELNVPTAEVRVTLTKSAH